MKVSFKIKPSRSKDGQRKGKVFVRVRNYTNNADFLISTGLEVITDYWNPDEQCYRANIPAEVIDKTEVKKVNEILLQLLMCIENNCNDQSDKPVIEQVVKMFFERLKENEPSGFTMSQRTKNVVAGVSKSVKGKNKANHL